MMTEPEIMGEKLKGIRKNLRYTLREVFEETGISISFLSDLERGKSNPSLDTIRKLANFYRVNLSDFLEDKETEEKKMDDEEDTTTTGIYCAHNILIKESRTDGDHLVCFMCKHDFGRVSMFPKQSIWHCRVSLSDKWFK